MESCSIFLEIFFNFTYYLGCSPFHLKQNAKISQKLNKTNFDIKSSCYQKTACAILTFLGLSRFLREIYLRLPTNFHSPSTYLKLAFFFGSIIMKVLTIHIFWTKQKYIQELANMLGEYDIEKNEFKKKTTTIRTYILCVVYSTLGFLYGCVTLIDWDHDKTIELSDERYIISIWISSVDRATRTFYFLPNNNTKTFNIFVVSIGILSSVYRRLLAVFADLLILIITLSLWCPMKQFTGMLNKNCKKLSWTTVQYHFTSLQILSDNINNIFGGIITGFLIGTVINYSTSFDTIFAHGYAKSLSYFAVMKLLIWTLLFFCNASAIFYFSADISHQINKTVKGWLKRSDNRRMVTVDETILLLKDLDDNSIAITGSNVFPITYSLVASVLGSTITYFIICVQATE